MGVVIEAGSPSPAVATDPPAGSSWLRQRERGTGVAIRSLLLATRLFGRRGVAPILWIIALYYTLFGGPARRASVAYLGRVLPGTRIGFAHRFRHILTFVRVSLDRVFFVQDRFDRFSITRTGGEHIQGLVARKRGAILLGAHLGSFEAMRAASRDRKARLNILVHFEHARKITSFLGAADPEFMARVIEIRPGQVGHVFEVQERLEAGELVGILADRVGIGAKVATVDFLGSPARFPTGPFALAATLGCPVYLTLGLFRPPRGYALHCEPFAECIQLPRHGRARALRELAQRYAGRLEHYCRLAPYNWFNFYDFWEGETHEGTAN